MRMRIMIKLVGGLRIGKGDGRRVLEEGGVVDG